MSDLDLGPIKELHSAVGDVVGLDTSTEDALINALGDTIAEVERLRAERAELCVKIAHIAATRAREVRHED